MNVNFTFNDYEEFLNTSRYLYGSLLKHRQLSDDDIKSFINGTVEFVQQLNNQLEAFQQTTYPVENKQLTLEEPRIETERWYAIGFPELNGKYECTKDGKVRRTPITPHQNPKYLTPSETGLFQFSVNGRYTVISQKAILQATFNIEPDWKRLDGDYSEFEISKEKGLRRVRTQTQLVPVRTNKDGSYSYRVSKNRKYRNVRVGDELVNKVFGGDLNGEISTF